MMERIDRVWLAAHGESRLLHHLNMGDRHVLARYVVDIRDARPIGLSYSDTSYKRVKRNGDLAGRSIRTWFVETHPDPIATLDDALEILAIIRQANEPEQLHA